MHINYKYMYTVNKQHMSLGTEYWVQRHMWRNAGRLPGQTPGQEEVCNNSDKR